MSDSSPSSRIRGPRYARAMKALALAVVLGAAFAPSAMASQRPTIDVDRADRAERAVTAASVESINADIDELVAELAALAPEEIDDSPDAVAVDPKIVDWSVDGCDRETQYRALCDWTVTYADGSTEDGVDEVIVKRNGRYIVRTARP
jgi:hypothetical protein